MASGAGSILLLVVLSSLVASSAARFSEIQDICQPSGKLHAPGGHSCDECCKEGESYPRYECSPQVTGKTKAILTVNDFEEGGDGGAPSECDNQYHDNSEPVVALSTGWYAKGSRCGKFVRISANGRTVRAKVVDECDSMNGCDKDHAFEPPCLNNIVDASPVVWKKLGVSQDDDDYGYMKITWAMDDE
ncbi:putative ripening-related protein 1 [Selaginella moellendorffii]|nr:putative ripening-related protein 1 [Selaginella moellendorffii]XP_002987416.2 putative ripening-related protein 1 [Selaginella moellendorffii]|eukprot:XP_002979938.2 putative ripening-related protein 1 [Selaginella moellendorffii]